jgi:ubiquinone/menaquinone biosynthesis C-methylase UbiE
MLKFMMELTSALAGGGCMDKEQAKRQWNSAAPGWAKWEPTIGVWLRQSTEAMLDAAQVSSGARVIDIACGAGDQSFAAARRIGADGKLLAIDISEEMVDFVDVQARNQGLSIISTRCCAVEDLHGEGDFDAAICRLGLMLIGDPQGVSRSVLQALRAGGRFGVVVIGAPGANPFLAEPLKILRRHAGKAPPPSGGPGIFALAETETLRTTLEGAGFEDVAIRTIDESLEMGSAEEAMQMIKDAFGVYRAIIGDQSAQVQDAAWAEALDFLRGFEGESGLRIPAQFHVAGAAAPR